MFIFKRFDIVTGKVEPSAEEIGSRIAELDSEGKEIKTNKEGSEVSGKKKKSNQTLNVDWFFFF